MRHRNIGAKTAALGIAQITSACGGMARKAARHLFAWRGSVRYAAASAHRRLKSASALSGIKRRLTHHRRNGVIRRRRRQRRAAASALKMALSASAASIFRQLRRHKARRRKHGLGAKRCKAQRRHQKRIMAYQASGMRRHRRFASGVNSLRRRRGGIRHLWRRRHRIGGAAAKWCSGVGK